MFLFFLFVMAPGILYAWGMKNSRENAEEHPKVELVTQIVLTGGLLAYIIWILSVISKAFV